MMYGNLTLLISSCTSWCRLTKGYGWGRRKLTRENIEGVLARPSIIFKAFLHAHTFRNITTQLINMSLSLRQLKFRDDHS